MSRPLSGRREQKIILEESSLKDKELRARIAHLNWQQNVTKDVLPQVTTGNYRGLEASNLVIYCEISARQLGWLVNPQIEGKIQDGT